MKNLVFVGKWIGLEVLRGLIENFPDDEYTFIVCEPDASKIGEFLSENNYSYKLISEEVIQTINQNPNQYYDWLLNLWGSYIFKPNIIAKAKKTLNIHPSYLPYCRGRDPVVWSVRYNWPAGVSFHEITEKVDEGAIWYQERVPTHFPEPAGVLYNQVVKTCIAAFKEKWPELRSAQLLPQLQIPLPDQSTFRRKDLLKDRIVDVSENKSAEEWLRWLLAHDFGDNYFPVVKIDNNYYKALLKLELLDNFKNS